MEIKTLNNENFKDIVSNATKPIIVDFYADWCGPCKMVMPVIEEIAKEHTEIEIYKVNVDESPEIAREFKVMSIPTIISFKDGVLNKKIMGAQPKDSILDLVK
ncbi:MAG: thioredoxin [Defluviitaleaceae bacterium]|nr:thioredoxin [Defluviitaleaceae bacterium]